MNTYPVTAFKLLNAMSTHPCTCEKLKDDQAWFKFKQELIAASLDKNGNPTGIITIDGPVKCMRCGEVLIDG